MPSTSVTLAYVDLQVNGYAGVDFNDQQLSAEELHRACQALRDDGAEHFLPTVITDEIETMAARLTQLASLRAADPLAREMIAGFHIEGPFIDGAPGFVGAHPPAAVRPPNLPDMQRLFDAADGLTQIVTLAPEHDSDFKVTRWLADQQVTVAAGHCNPTHDDLRGAIDAGLKMFTHLGNGCPSQLDRHDNVIERVLSLAEKLCISFIADGCHVPFFALGNYLRAAGVERCVVVSDAISAAGLGPGRYSIGGQIAVVGEDGVPRPPDDDSHFVGSATSVSQMLEKLRRELGLSDQEIEHLASSGPRKILRGS